MFSETLVTLKTSTFFTINKPSIMSTRKLQHLKNLMLGFAHSNWKNLNISKMYGEAKLLIRSIEESIENSASSFTNNVLFLMC